MNSHPQGDSKIQNIYKIEFVEENVGRIREESKKWLTWRFQVIDAVITTPPSPADEEATLPIDLLSSSPPLLLPPTEPTPPDTQMEPPPVPTATARIYSVSVTWSFASGKQEIQMNGQVVWFGRRSGGSILSHAWSEDDLQLEVLGTSHVPKRHVSHGFRCFDLMINGRRFDELPVLGKQEVIPLTTIATADLPISVVEILYPNGYVWTPSNMDSNDPNSYRYTD
jgi:hypothetical protein